MSRRMSERDARFWAERRFVRETAAEMHMEFVREVCGHEPLEIEPKDEFRARIDGVDEEEAPTVIEEIPARPWSGDLPRPVASFQRAAEKVGYDCAASYSHQERRGAHGRLLGIPEADMCTLACVRGGERFIAIWANLGGAWKFETSLDFSPHAGIVPQIRKITALKKERLT